MPSSRVSRFLGLVGVCLVAVARGSGTSAQEAFDASAPAHVMHVEGSATLERDGQIEVVTLNMPVVAGDRLRTSAGRVEILFPDTTALDVDEDSDVDVLSPTLLRISAGRAMLTVAGPGDPSGAVRYQVDTPAAAIETDGPGEFRITVLDRRGDETELAVTRGFARLTNDRGSATVRAGEQSIAFDGSAPTRTQIFNSARFDPFDRWVAERRSERVAAASARYLPRDLQVYGGALDRDGSWRNEAPYGNVWYPTVASDWQPYYNGYWSTVPSYGWTWIGADVWSWPTHHYGRWGHNGRAWFWIPGRTWGPAWVSWAAASDYVSWCPLGFDGRPVFALSIGTGAPWNGGWTIVPRTSFGYRGLRVDRYAVASQRVPRSTPFVMSARPPIGVPRSVLTNQPGRPNGNRSAYRERPASGDGARTVGNARDAGRTSPDPGFGRRTDRAPTESSQTAIPRSFERRGDGNDSGRTPRATTPTARETPGLDPRFRQPMPDAFRRRSPDAGASQNPTGSRPVARPAERAEARERAAPPSARQEVPATAQSAPSAPIYRRSDRSPERVPDRPAERAAGRSPERSPERASPPASPPPRSAPESSGARPRNGSDGERAVPRHDGSGERSRGEGRRR